MDHHIHSRGHLFRCSHDTVLGDVGIADAHRLYWGSRRKFDWPKSDTTHRWSKGFFEPPRLPGRDTSVCPHHVSSEILNEIAQGEPFHHTIARQNLFWFGQLARMGTQRLRKQAAFGFRKRHMIRERPIMRQGQLNRFVSWIGVDWHESLVTDFPTGSRSRNKIRRLSEIRLSDGYLGIHEFSYRRVKRQKERHMVTDPVTGMCHCPLCAAWFDKANSLKCQYEGQPAIADVAFSRSQCIHVTRIRGPRSSGSGPKNHEARSSCLWDDVWSFVGSFAAARDGGGGGVLIQVQVE